MVSDSSLNVIFCGLIFILISLIPTSLKANPITTKPADLDIDLNYLSSLNTSIPLHLNCSLSFNIYISGPQTLELNDELSELILYWTHLRIFQLVDSSLVHNIDQYTDDFFNEYYLNYTSIDTADTDTSNIIILSVNICVSIIQIKYIIQSELLADGDEVAAYIKYNLIEYNPEYNEDDIDISIEIYLTTTISPSSTYTIKPTKRETISNYNEASLFTEKLIYIGIILLCIILMGCVIVVICVLKIKTKTEKKLEKAVRDIQKQHNMKKDKAISADNQNQNIAIEISKPQHKKRQSIWDLMLKKTQPPDVNIDKNPSCNTLDPSGIPNRMCPSSTLSVSPSVNNKPLYKLGTDISSNINVNLHRNTLGYKDNKEEEKMDCVLESKPIAIPDDDIINDARNDNLFLQNNQYSTPNHRKLMNNYFNNDNIPMPMRHSKSMIVSNMNNNRNLNDIQLIRSWIDDGDIDHDINMNNNDMIVIPPPQRYLPQHPPRHSYHIPNNNHSNHPNYGYFNLPKQMRNSLPSLRLKRNNNNNNVFAKPNLNKNYHSCQVPNHNHTSSLSPQHHHRYSHPSLSPQPGFIPSIHRRGSSASCKELSNSKHVKNSSSMFAVCNHSMYHAGNLKSMDVDDIHLGLNKHVQPMPSITSSKNTITGDTIANMHATLDDDDHDIIHIGLWIDDNMSESSHDSVNNQSATPQTKGSDNNINVINPNRIHGCGRNNNKLNHLDNVEEGTLKERQKSAQIEGIKRRILKLPKLHVHQQNDINLPPSPQTTPSKSDDINSSNGSGSGSDDERSQSPLNIIDNDDAASVQHNNMNINNVNGIIIMNMNDEMEYKQQNERNGVGVYKILKNNITLTQKLEPDQMNNVIIPPAPPAPPPPPPVPSQSQPVKVVLEPGNSNNNNKKKHNNNNISNIPINPIVKNNGCKCNKCKNNNNKKHKSIHIALGSNHINFLDSITNHISEDDRGLSSSDDDEEGDDDDDDDDDLEKQLTLNISNISDDDDDDDNNEGYDDLSVLAIHNQSSYTFSQRSQFLASNHPPNLSYMIPHNPNM